MKQNFKQTIQVDDKNIADIFRLPCVRSIWKTEDSSFKVEIDINCLKPQVGLFVASPSDWLCENYDGTWCILTDKEHKEDSL